MVAGRWLRPADAASTTTVAVIGRALATTTGTHVGDTIFAGTARGSVDVQVVGIDANLNNNGTTIYLPLTKFQQLLGRHDVNAFWVVSMSQFVRSLARLVTTLDLGLASAGYPVASEVHYVERAANLDSNRVLVAVLAAISIPIVIIGMIGLLNSMTMNVIERTRDIGVLRCIGASSRTVRRVFRAEALTVAFVGAALAIPGGWLVGRLLTWIVCDLFHFGSVPYAFPGVSALLAVVVTLALAGFVVVAPLRRASHMNPGDALRYE
jgi:putative ABC transport system permease protein